MTTIENREMTHADLVTLTSYMADNGYTPTEIAYAVEKPWKHGDVLTAAQQAAETP